jgi:long-subunit acyl-CoA synthetase (AMP-forming)
MAWMRECFADVQVGNNYGATELPGISTDGWVLPNVEVRVESVPEMGYDADEGKGEVVVRTLEPPMTPGYHNKPEATAKAFRDGWYYTGDIGVLEQREVPGEEGSTAPHLTLIDRLKNRIELYVDGRSVWTAGGKIETVLAGCDLVQHVFVHGERTQSTCVAVVVADREQMAQAFPEVAPSEWDESEQVKQFVLERLIAVATESGFLEAFEIPQLLVLDDAEWSVESGMLAGIGKVKRPAVLQRYREAIDRAYLRWNELGH